jgi:hypothetical protein
VSRIVIGVAACARRRRGFVNGIVTALFAAIRASRAASSAGNRHTGIFSSFVAGLTAGAAYGLVVGVVNGLIDVAALVQKLMGSSAAGAQLHRSYCGCAQRTVSPGRLVPASVDDPDEYTRATHKAIGARRNRRDRDRTVDLQRL